MSDSLRYFLPPQNLQNDHVEIDGSACHHLRNVLRVKTGETITLLDGKGLCCEVIIEQISKSKLLAKVIRRWREEDKTVPVTIIQALPKGDKIELVLQKGTELGVRCFQPMTSAHAIPQFDSDRFSKREDRWRRIVSEAARQCRSAVLPEIKPIQPLSKILTEQTPDLKLALWENSAVPLSSILPTQKPEGVRILVGPEGGFTEHEINAITAAGFQNVHLGPRILRTETAGLAVTPILQYLYGDWLLSPGRGISHA